MPIGDWQQGWGQGFWAGHSDSSTPAFAKLVFMDLALCTGALSCWKALVSLKGNLNAAKGNVNAANFVATVWGKPAYGCDGQVSSSFHKWNWRYSSGQEWSCIQSPALPLKHCCSLLFRILCQWKIVSLEWKETVVYAFQATYYIYLFAKHSSRAKMLVELLFLPAERTQFRQFWHLTRKSVVTASPSRRRVGKTDERTT